MKPGEWKIAGRVFAAGTLLLITLLGIEVYWAVEYIKEGDWVWAFVAVLGVAWLAYASHRTWLDCQEFYRRSRGGKDGTPRMAR